MGPVDLKLQSAGVMAVGVSLALFAFQPTPASAGCARTACAPAPIDLGTLGGNAPAEKGIINSYAADVAAGGGIVAGYALTSDPAQYVHHAFIWRSGRMTDLGTLGGVSSHALGISRNGAVVVGVAALPSNDLRAFRWTARSGMVDLGGTHSAAWAANDDGSVIVGQTDVLVASATPHLETRAFRWTASGGMAVLQGLGPTGGAQAYGVSGDGHAVVGVTDTPSGNDHAFLWSTAKGMTDLGTLGGPDSQANAVNRAGTVVVGWASPLPGAGDRHAFRWSRGTGMVDLGVLPGGHVSIANDVSDDGSVIVGWSGTGGPNGPGTGAARAVRWTAKSGLGDLNTLLVNAGVDMTGITLSEANGVSGDGQFIVGQADFPSGSNRGFLVRYDDGPQHNGRAIAGITTPQAIQASIDDLGRARQQALIEQQALTNAVPNLSSFDALPGLPSGMGLRFNAKLVASDRWGASPVGLQGDAVRANLALRYLPSNSARFRALVEAVGWTEPYKPMSFERKYSNGNGLSVGAGYANTMSSGAYARAGIAWNPTNTDSVTLTSELGRVWSTVGAYAERSSQANPFEAYVSSGTDMMSVTKARISWVRHCGAFDLSTWAAVAQSIDETVGLTATVPGSGELTPLDLAHSAWAEYGGHLAYRPNAHFTADVLVGGVSSSASTRAQLRATVRLEL